MKSLQIIIDYYLFKNESTLTIEILTLENYLKNPVFVSKTDQLGLQLSSKIIFYFWGYFFSIKPMKII